ncbi:hypothetical protein B0H14DRAFT_2602258 [Mycena olivaceomarginata]|nr:hypothetical protein B0H14DRAFT_2602258 [Mycena olivaceomarginata]
MLLVSLAPPSCPLPLGALCCLFACGAELSSWPLPVSAPVYPTQDLGAQGSNYHQLLPVLVAIRSLRTDSLHWGCSALPACARSWLGHSDNRRALLAPSSAHGDATHQLIIPHRLDRGFVQIRL